ncbi:hypothetical protein Q4543_17620 [Salipiger sp. 1_MG-2023]|uniref:hypothetical protein n=1 Tax=Salipiger sp. 1_MG-2023 TaxID=3062665 RepID=UPI0026E2D477|nr:hypothetical protein [Salipiger sp. 1_MG-2023]MDO6587334.1 hypothetical protein [Salipiger sp. 1_MG-2023]
MTLVEFKQDHVYGGIAFKAGETLECPDKRAKMLQKAGVAKIPRKSKDADE